PRIRVEHREVTEIPADRPVILATGPLTSDGLAKSLEAAVGAEHLAYYDAIAPIVSAESIDWTRVWKQSRYGKGGALRPIGEQPEESAADAEAGGDEAYVNCAFDEAGYKAFVKALVDAAKGPAGDREE